jgi:acyl-CoA thioesterase FadM
MAEAFIVPIRHAESDFHRPMYPGHTYEARLVISTLGESSFEVWTRFYDAGANPAEAGSPVLCAETHVAHVFADPRRFRKIPIPSALRARLEAHLSGE